MRLPNHMIEKWKALVADMREKGQTPTVNHIGEFVRKRVNPDFVDLQRDSRTLKNEHLRKDTYAADHDSNKSA